ncbi:MAG: hypothetical protein V4487_00495 [Chlamydiota bacterium]
MDAKKSISLLLLFGTAVSFLSIALFLKKGTYPLLGTAPPEGLLVQNTYFGPNHPLPGNPHLVRVEILIHDSTEPGGVQIQSVLFNEQNIPLKPRDVYGYRGKGSFQVPPGKYKLKWSVHRDRVIWPRTLSYEELVTIDPRDLWIQISIQGEKASIR